MPAPFQLLPEQVAEKEVQYQHDQQVYTQKLSQFVQQKGLVRLHSDYFSINYYYWSPGMHQMYTVNSVSLSNKEPRFEISHDRHIMALNHLL